MFDIEYKGGNTVIISTKKTVVIADPKQSVIGLKDILIKEAIEVATESRFAVNGANARIHIEGPGEYEVGEVAIKGVPATRHIDTAVDAKISTIYRIEIGDARIGLLGNIADKLSESQLEELGVVDILLLPVGGNGYTLDATSAATITRQVEPKVVIPLHYNDETLKYEVAQGELSEFTKELGAPTETVAKFKVKSAASLPQSLTVIEVTRS